MDDRIFRPTMFSNVPYSITGKEFLHLVALFSTQHVEQPDETNHQVKLGFTTTVFTAKANTLIPCC
jgi:hypothetical protein